MQDGIAEGGVLRIIISWGCFRILSRRWSSKDHRLGMLSKLVKLHVAPEGWRWRSFSPPCLVQRIPKGQFLWQWHGIGYGNDNGTMAGRNDSSSVFQITIVWDQKTPARHVANILKCKCKCNCKWDNTRNTANTGFHNATSNTNWKCQLANFPRHSLQDRGNGTGWAFCIEQSFSSPVILQSNQPCLICTTTTPPPRPYCRRAKTTISYHLESVPSSFPST